jgi:hypothetical protein
MRTSDNGFKEKTARVRVKHLGNPPVWVEKVRNPVFPRTKQEEAGPHRYATDTLDLFEDI